MNSPSGFPTHPRVAWSRSIVVAGTGVRAGTVVITDSLCTERRITRAHSAIQRRARALVLVCTTRTKAAPKSSTH